MRNLKRFLAMTLTMLMVIGSFSFASFAQDFDDVYDYADAIDVLSDLGVIWGYEDGTFGPDNTVERWHMSLWIAKMETGKVTTDDYLTIWRAEENYTDFTDVAVDQAIGAINYAADEGIIIGTSPTTFAPTAGIMYQDALTMVVRALGFGSPAMDAGYPWKFINKAAELGLEEGITGVAYRDVLTRAETAQILYNALYTVDADGNTYVSDVFGLSTVVITGTPAYKITQTEAVIKAGYVSFNILNGDGTINTDVTYHLPATAFGLTAANADNYVGASFRVTTKNNFKTLGVVIENPSEVFEAADIVGAGAAAAPSAMLTLDGTSYQAVNKFTALYNAQGIKGNTDEILVYITNMTQSTADGYFKVDANYNVLDAAGHIVAHYAPAITGSYAAPYVKLLGNNTYAPFANNNDNQKASIIAAGGVWNAAVQNTYLHSVDTYDLVKNNKYATAKAYDDNADGMYDRMFYTYQEFTELTYDAVALTYGLNGGQKAVVKFVNGTTGEEITPKPTTGYHRYSYNPLSKVVTVYETYKYGTGLVTTVNTAAAKIVIGGTQYTVGLANFPGATYADSKVALSLVGKQVNFILVDGVVVRVFDAASAGSYIVYDNMTGITAQGYGTALVYVQAPAASVITIATINGYSFQQYWLFAQQGSLQNIMPLETGDLFIGTKDALGFWHLQTQPYTATVTGSVSFKNGIGTAAGFTFGQFETSADTVYIVYDEATDKFTTRKGVPVDGSVMTVDGGLFACLPAANTASFIYANEGAFVGFNIQAPPVFANDTIIYVNKSAQPTIITNDIGSTGTLLGNTYQYGNVLDMITGKLITVQAGYNVMLEGGNFYSVYNGYVEDKIIPSSKGINLGALYTYTPYTSTIYFGGADDVENSAKTLIYNLVNGDVELNADGTLKTIAPAASVLPVAVYYYSGTMQHNRVMLHDSTKTPVLRPVPVTYPNPIPNANVVMYDVDLNGNQIIDEPSQASAVASEQDAHPVVDDTLRFYFTGLQKYVAPTSPVAPFDPACREDCFPGFDNEDQTPKTDGVMAGHHITIYAVPDECHTVVGHSNGTCNPCTEGTSSQYAYDKIVIAEGIYYADEAGELVVDALEYVSECDFVNGTPPIIGYNPPICVDGKCICTPIYGATPSSWDWGTENFTLCDEGNALTFKCHSCDATTTLSYFEGEYEFVVVIEALDNANNIIKFGTTPNLKEAMYLRPSWQPSVVLTAQSYIDQDLYNDAVGYELPMNTEAVLFQAELINGCGQGTVTVDDPWFTVPTSGGKKVEVIDGLNVIIGGKPFIKYRDLAAGEALHESRFWGEGYRYNLMTLLDYGLFNRFVVTYPLDGVGHVAENNVPIPIFDRDGHEHRKNLKIGFTAESYISAARELDWKNVNFMYVLPFAVDPAETDQTIN